MSPRAECRDVQCLPCVCVCRSRNSHRFDGVAPLFQGNQSSQATAWIPRRPRGLLLDDIFHFLGCSCRFLLRAGGKERSGYFVVVNISAVRILLLRGTGTFPKGVTLESSRVAPSRSTEQLDPTVGLLL